MAKKLFISDERMIALMDQAVEKGIAGSVTEYLEMIGYARTNLVHVREGRQGFKKDHILKAAEITGANINWIFGIESNVYRKTAKDPIEMIKEAIVSLENEKVKPLPKKLPNIGKASKKSA